MRDIKAYPRQLPPVAFLVVLEATPGGISSRRPGRIPPVAILGPWELQGHILGCRHPRQTPGSRLWGTRPKPRPGGILGGDLGGGPLAHPRWLFFFVFLLSAGARWTPGGRQVWYMRHVQILNNFKRRRPPGRYPRYRQVWYLGDVSFQIIAAMGVWDQAGFMHGAICMWLLMEA